MADQPPDWGRYGIAGNKAFPPVGDPNRWGASVTLSLGVAFGVAVADQFLRVSTMDAHSRSWSMLGSLTLSKAMWDAMFVAPIANPINVLLDCYQGVGQTIVKQSIVLAAGTATGGFNFGLCLQQDYLRGSGPYFPETQGVAPDETVTRSFSAIGALIGHTINISARVIQVTAIPPAVPSDAVFNVVLAPYAAGEKL